MVCTHRVRLERSNRANIDEKPVSFKKLRKETGRDLVTKQEPFARKPYAMVVNLSKLFIHQLQDRRPVTGCKSHTKLILKLLQIQSVASQAQEHTLVHQLPGPHKLPRNKRGTVPQKPIAVM